MPANVTVEFVKAKEKYEKAASPREKLLALQEMKRTEPKHKGGEKLRAGISGKIAKLKKQIEKQKIQEKKRASAPGLSVRKEGGGQVVLVGLPNSGKSTLLNALTKVDVAIAPYPFTTKKPVVGMMNYNRALVQLVEVPALVEGSSKGKAQGTQILSIIRNADAVVLVVRNKREEKILLNELGRANILLNEKKPLIKVSPSEFRGITVSGEKYLKIEKAELIDFLKSTGIYNASVVLNEETDLKKIAQTLDERIVYKKALTINSPWEDDLEKLKKDVFNLLDKILIFTKKPGKNADKKEPLLLKKGATIEDVARLLHKDFARKLKYARVWGSAKFPGQRVSRGYELKSWDIVEIYC